MKAFTTTIKSVYMRMKELDHIENGYFDEFKNDTDFWNKRLKGVRPGSKAVFLEGSKPHYFTVKGIGWIVVDHVPEKYRGAIETRSVNMIRCA